MAITANTRGRQAQPRGLCPVDRPGSHPRACPGPRTHTHQRPPHCHPRVTMAGVLILGVLLTGGTGGCSLFQTPRSPHPQGHQPTAHSPAETGSRAGGTGRTGIEPAAAGPSSMATPPTGDGAVASLGSGDIITVKVFREPDLSGDYLIGNDGDLSFPLVGKVNAADLTPSQLGDRLERLLGECCLQEPSVSVLIKEYTSKMIHVFGQVQKPGSFPYQDNMTVVQAITMSGGFTKTAWQSRTTITRRSGSQGHGTRITAPMDAILQGNRENVPLQPGDIIFIPESLF